jgi:hypothetical protein
VLLSELAWVPLLVCRSELRSGAAWEHWSAPTLVQMTAPRSELPLVTLLEPLLETSSERLSVEHLARLLMLQAQTSGLSMAPQSALPTVPQTARQSAKQWVWQRVLL